MMIHIWTDGNVRKENQKDSKGTARINHIGFLKESPYEKSKTLWRCSVIKQYMTVPEAEMEAALEGLRKVKNYMRENEGIEKILLHTDSQLVEKWIKGEYKCKAQNIRPYLDQIFMVMSSIDADIKIIKVASEENRAHDVLSQPGGVELE